MATKKDFANLRTDRVYDAINEATAEPEDLLTPNKTQGRKGQRAPRINLAFRPEIYDYVKTMSAVRGQTITDLVNHIIAKNMEENREVYEKAREFRKSF